MNARRRLALLEVRTVHSTLVGMDTFSTSLGNGAPVRLQLPRVKTVSYSGTVLVPTN